MIQISRLLCPIDFSQFSRDALDHAIALASWYRADLTVMHVFDIPPVPPPIAGFPVEAAMLPAPVNTAAIADQVERFARQAIGDTDIKMEIVVSTGNTAAEIARQAERLPADLLILGTHGRSGFERLFLGSVTERLLRTTTVPIMTIPPPVKKPESVRYEVILCPVDFSGESLRALEYALSLAQESDANIMLLHVLEGFADEPDSPEFADMHLRTYHQVLENDAATRLAGMVPEEARVWSRPTERVVKGKAYRQILRVAEDSNADLIVMGVRGRGALDRVLFGSTTDYVIRQAKCPVLTIHR